MIKGIIWQLWALRTGLSILALMPGQLAAQTVQNRTIEFPGGGTRNNNGSIGPFCCTGETAIIHDVDGKPAGYIYFYDFSGAKMIGADRSAASTVSILIGSASDQTLFPSARFAAENWTPGTTATVGLGALTYEVTIEPELVTIDGHQYFDMGSLKATVRVTSNGLASAGAAEPEPTSTDAAAAPSPSPAALTVDQSIDAVAGEFVADEIPMTDNRRLAAQGGEVLIPCIMRYPETDTNIETDHYDASPDIGLKTQVAVESAYIMQNLIAAGVPEDAASQLLKDYRAGRATFKKLSAADRDQLENNQISPDWRLIHALNNLGKPGLPTFKNPRKCMPVAFLKSATPYRFTLSPSGGRMFIIPLFSFKLCERRNVDPYSRAECDNWVEVGSGLKAKIAGRYRYSAEWPDGRFARDVMTFAVDGREVHDVPMTPQN